MWASSKIAQKQPNPIIDSSEAIVDTEEEEDEETGRQGDEDAKVWDDKRALSACLARSRTDKAIRLLLGLANSRWYPSNVHSPPKQSLSSSSTCMSCSVWGGLSLSSIDNAFSGQYSQYNCTLKFLEEVSKRVRSTALLSNYMSYKKTSTIEKLHYSSIEITKLYKYHFLSFIFL